jgi:hypothetical protein
LLPGLQAAFGNDGESSIAVQQRWKIAAKLDCFTPPSYGIRGRSNECSRLWLARPASFGKDHAPFVGGAAKRARSFKGFIAIGPGGHLTRNLQRVLSSLVPIQPISFR